MFGAHITNFLAVVPHLAETRKRFLKPDGIASLQLLLYYMYVLWGAAVTWLKYCRYGVKHYPINQSIFSGVARKFFKYRHNDEIRCEPGPGQGLKLK